MERDDNEMGGHLRNEDTLGFWMQVLKVNNHTEYDIHKVAENIPRLLVGSCHNS